MAYKLQITQKAEQDLDEIFAYLIHELNNVEAVLHLADEVERHYGLLPDNPFLYEKCRQPLLRHFRKVVIGGYLMFYRVDEDQQIIYIQRFFSNLQDYATKL